MDNVIPKWINIVSILLSLLSLFVGFSLYFSPSSFIPNIDFSLKEINYLKNMWAARQVTIGAIIGYSIVKRSKPMLKLSLIAYALMNIQDIFIGISTSDNGLIIGASFFFILPTFMLFVLNRKKEIKS